jgi:hypothetical protein
MSGLKCAVVGLGLGRHFLAALDQNENVEEIVVVIPTSKERPGPLKVPTRLRRAIAT